MTTKAEKSANRAEAISELRKLLKPGDRVYTTTLRVSSGGMSRVISCTIPTRATLKVWPPKPESEAAYPGQTDFSAAPKVQADGLRIRRISHLVARATDRSYDADKGGVKIGGCGSDMGFEIVYALGKALWPNGTRKPHGTRNGVPDSDGGYALKHEWL